MIHRANLIANNGYAERKFAFGATWIRARNDSLGRSHVIAEKRGIRAAEGSHRKFVLAISKWNLRG